MTKTTGRVHIYCRVSSTGQEDGYSLDPQDAACRAWAAERGHTVAAVAHEVGSGGTRFRPQLETMIASLLPGEIFLAYALDRFSRSQIDTAILVDRIEVAGASLHLVTEDFEQSATGTFIRGAKSFAAELHLEKIREATQRGRRARVDDGKPIVGPVCAYGYVWNHDKTRYVIDPVTAPVVRMIFDWALAGVTLRGIAARLAEREIPSPTGQPRWTPAVIRNLLLRPVYAGNYVAYRKRAERQKATGKYKQRPGRADELVTLPGAADAIISAEEQARVVAQLSVNAAKSTRNNRDPQATLLRAGYVVCGHCGWNMAVAHSPAGRPGSAPQYRCTDRAKFTHGCPLPTIAAPGIDEAVWSQVSAFLRDPDLIAERVARHRHAGGLERDHAALEKQLTEIATKQTNTARAIAALADDVAAAPLLAELKSLAALKATAQAERDALATRLADVAADSARVLRLREWSARVAANLETLSYDERRSVLDVLGVQVQVYKPGSVAADGTPLPRATMTLAPSGDDDAIVYPLARR